jgi:ferredoxin-NADP reductase
MRAPTVHLNGTSKEMLLEQVCDAGHALRKALEAMREAAPNGRDYYVQGPEAFKEAAEEHAARDRQVREVLKQYENLAEKIADQ